MNRGKSSNKLLNQLIEKAAQRKQVKGLEKESAEKQQKYDEVFGDQLDNGDDITFTGMYKYVDSGYTDKFDFPIYKRKRIFRKRNQVMRYLSGEQREEIITAFHLFDSDKSNTIDINELKDAMKALGIFMSKQQSNEIMERIDKNGSGQLEKDEFIALMSEIMHKRNQEVEMRKVFRFYDNDDDGTISYDNIWQAADQLDLEEELSEQTVNMMIEMADKSNRGSVHEHEFIALMKELGLIPEQEYQEESVEKKEQNQEKYELAQKQREDERIRAEEKAELMRRKAAAGNTPMM